MGTDQKAVPIYYLCHHKYEDMSIKPLHIAEVLTVGKIGILWIHTHATAERTGFIRLDDGFESI